jgi:cell division septation protein DedD
MRALVFLLVAANLVFFAWTQGYLGSRESPDAVRLTQQLNADKLSVLSRNDPPGARPEQRGETAAEKAPVAEKAATVADRCVAWLGLAESSAAELEALLAEKFDALRRVRHVVPETSSWWVFIPPQANKAEADKKAGELKKLGVPEFFVVQDAGPNRFAISLGIFSSEQAANDRLETLKGKGVRSARVGRRGDAKPVQISIEATGPEPLANAAVEAAAQQWPDLKTAGCGKP